VTDRYGIGSKREYQKGKTVELTILSDDLVKALATVGRAVESRPTLPVLSHVLIKAEEYGTVEFAGTNLEQFVVKRVDLNVDMEGALTVPWRLFNDLAATFPDGEPVELSTPDDPDGLRVKCGKAEANLKGISADEFPKLPYIEGEPITRFAPGDLMTRLSQVTYAAATDESRLILTGVFVETKSGDLSFVTADGFRLAWRRDEIMGEFNLKDVTAGNTGSFVMPAECAVDLVRLLAAQIKDEHKEDVVLFLNPQRSQAMFRLYDVDVTTQLIEGQFVNYRQIVPQSHATRTVADRRELTALLKSAQVFNPIKGLPFTVRLVIEWDYSRAEAELNNTGKLTVTASGIEIGEFSGDMHCHLEGEPVEIAFNCKFLLEALTACGTPKVALELNGGTHPGVVKPVGNDNYQCVIMPMHIRS
jgi:DNA polymerase-3 subunit beta